MTEPTHTPIDIWQPMEPGKIMKYELRPRPPRNALGLLTALLIVGIVLDSYRIARIQSLHAEVKKLEALVEKLEPNQP